MKKVSVRDKVINEILPSKMQFEECWGCGSKKFFVVFSEFKSMPPLNPKELKELFKKFPSLKPKGPIKKVKITPFPHDLAVDVQFWCVKCGEMSSGVFFNQELVDMKSSTKKMTREELMAQEKEMRRNRTAMKNPKLEKAPLPK